MLCPRPNSVDCQLGLCLPLHSDLGHVLYLVVVSLVTRAVDPHKPVKPVCRSGCWNLKISYYVIRILLNINLHHFNEISSLAIHTSRQLDCDAEHDGLHGFTGASSTSPSPLGPVTRCKTPPRHCYFDINEHSTSSTEASNVYLQSEHFFISHSWSSSVSSCTSDITRLS